MINKKVKNNNGVTLVILVITIVVLAILLSITISVFTGNNGLINRIKKAKSDEEAAQVAGQEKINSIKSEEKYTSDGTIIQNYEDAPVIDGITITEQTNSSFKVNVNIRTSYSGINKVEYSCKNGIEGSYVTNENDPRITTYNFEGLEANTIYLIKVIVTANNGNSSTAEAIGITSTSKTPATIQGATHLEGAVNSGYVMKDGNENEWVWVPKEEAVLDVSYYNGDETSINTAIERVYNVGKYPLAIKYNDTDYRGITYNFEYDSSSTENKPTYYRYINEYEIDVIKRELGDDKQTVLNSTVKSIQKYGGFYVGRYGITGTEDVPTIKPYSELLNYVFSYNNFGDYYDMSKKILSYENVQTGLIWGYQWDAMMIWLLQTFDKTYKQLADTTTLSEWSGYNSSKITRSNEIDKANNIYDLAGYECYIVEGTKNLTYANIYRLGAVRKEYSNKAKGYRAIIIID